MTRAELAQDVDNLINETATVSAKERADLVEVIVEYFTSNEGELSLDGIDEEDSDEEEE